jgi:hypothetical protein
MTVTTYPIRLFGGRNLAVAYDDVAGTLSILNQSINLSALSAGLQAGWASAVATTPPPVPPSGVRNPAAFAGDNIQQTAGTILDAVPTWRSAVQAALATIPSG